MSNKNEGNLVSFKVFLDYGGTVVTELSGVPEDKLHTIFKGDELQLIRRLVRSAREKLEPMHEYLEEELSAFSAASFQASQL